MHLNPNHEMAIAMNDQWFKIALIIMTKLGHTSIDITAEDLDLLSEGDCIVAEGFDEILRIRVVHEEEAIQIAKEAGGLPC